MILDPITIAPDQTIRDAHQLMAKYRISGIPVTKDGRLVGIITHRWSCFNGQLCGGRFATLAEHLHELGI